MTSLFSGRHELTTPPVGVRSVASTNKPEQVLSRRRRGVAPLTGKEPSRAPGVCSLAVPIAQIQQGAVAPAGDAARELS